MIVRAVNLTESRIIWEMGPWVCPQRIMWIVHWSGKTHLDCGCDNSPEQEVYVGRRKSAKHSHSPSAALCFLNVDAWDLPATCFCHYAFPDTKISPSSLRRKGIASAGYCIIATVKETKTMVLKLCVQSLG